MAFRAETIGHARVGVRRITALQVERVRPKPNSSPYVGIDMDDWLVRTMELLEDHPLSVDHVIDAVLLSWEGIFATTMGNHGLQIGVHIKPAPQVMGLFLHELIPYELAGFEPEGWVVGNAANEKDAVCLYDDFFSMEVKTSSHPNQIFGNRSFGQQGGAGKKAKDGYYVAVNFDSWTGAEQPEIRRVRWGWLDHTDWYAQQAASGQQSSLPSPVENYQLLTLYER